MYTTAVTNKRCNGTSQGVTHIAHKTHTRSNPSPHFRRELQRQRTALYTTTKPIGRDDALRAGRGRRGNVVMGMARPRHGGVLRYSGLGGQLIRLNTNSRSSSAPSTRHMSVLFGCGHTINCFCAHAGSTGIWSRPSRAAPRVMPMGTSGRELNAWAIQRAGEDVGECLKVPAWIVGVSAVVVLDDAEINDRER